MRYRLWIVLCLFPLCIYGAVYTPQTLPDPKEHGQWEYVANPDNILSGEEVRFLNACAKSLQDSTAVELCVAALGNIGDMDMFDITYQLFGHWRQGTQYGRTRMLRA